MVAGSRFDSRFDDIPPCRDGNGEYVVCPDLPVLISLEDFRLEYLGLGTSFDSRPDKTSPRLVYLAGPYRPYVDEDGTKHTIAENVRLAGQYGIEIWRMGYVAVVPHTMTYLSPSMQKQDGGITGVPPEVFLKGELELLSRCDLLVLMPTWRISKGAVAERMHALRLGIPVLEWEDFLEMWEAQQFMGDGSDE